MKKNNLIIGLAYLMSGIACLAFILVFETKLNSIISGFATAGIIFGAFSMYKYYYWRKSKNKSAYNERMEDRDIELRDERKEMLRDKSGRYTYILGLIVLSISIIVFSILGALKIIGNSNLIVIYLWVLFIFQYVIGIVIYRYLSKKY